MFSASGNPGILLKRQVSKSNFQTPPCSVTNMACTVGSGLNVMADAGDLPFLQEGIMAPVFKTGLCMRSFGYRIVGREGFGTTCKDSACYRY